MTTLSYEQVQQAMRDARETIRRVGNMANSLAEMLSERAVLRAASPSYLRDIKRQLKKFDSTTGKWRD